MGKVMTNQIGRMGWSPAPANKRIDYLQTWEHPNACDIRIAIYEPECGHSIVKIKDQMTKIEMQNASIADLRIILELVEIIKERRDVYRDISKNVVQDKDAV